MPVNISSRASATFATAVSNPTLFAFAGPDRPNQARAEGSPTISAAHVVPVPPPSTPRTTSWKCVAIERARGIATARNNNDEAEEQLMVVASAYHDARAKI